MISRYNRPKIEKIWTLENKFKIWTEIEILIAEKLSDIHRTPLEKIATITSNNATELFRL